MKRRILVVEDDEPLRGLIRDLLVLDGYEVLEAGDGAGLRRALGDKAPDAVILDIQLPDGNGLDLLPEVKQKWPGTKVIVLTGHGTVDAARQAYAQMEDIYFENKPFDPALFKAMLELALSAKTERR